MEGDDFVQENLKDSDPFHHQHTSSQPNHRGHEHVAPGEHTWSFAIGVGLNLAYVVVEAVAGLWSGSVALLADAGHNLSDVLGLLLAWGGFALSRMAPTKRYTYGFGSSSILAALFNALLLLMALGAIVWEAAGRFVQPVPVSGSFVVSVAALGVIINAATTALFVRGRTHDLNIRGAFVHMAADTAVSAGVVVAGVLISWTGWLWIDPTVSFLIAGFIFWGTWSLLRDSLALALNAVPDHIDPLRVERVLQEQPGVAEVHDLHIWAMSTTRTALTVHLVRPQGDLDDQFLAQTAQILLDEFGIGHVTIQVERDPAAAECRQTDPKRL